MSRDYKVYLDDVREAIGKIRRYTEGMSRDSFFADERTIDAVVRNLEVIGEAVKNLPGSMRDQYPDVEWQKIAGLRDILIHEYFGIDAEIIWDIVQTKLLALADRVEEALKGQ